jgi:drug/metabolite transporter (DMT)-like permease
VRGSALRGRALAVYIFLCAVWGSTWLVIRVGVRDLPPLWFAAMRMGLACLLLTPLAWRRSAVSPTKSEWGAVAWSGLLQIGISYAAVFLAAERIESSLSALLFGSFPIWTGIFAHRLLPEEPWNRWTAAAALIGVAGVGVIEAPAAVRALSGEAGPLFVGGLLVLSSAFISGYANVLVKKRLGRVPPVLNVWGQTLVGSVFLLSAALLFERGAPLRWSASSVASLAYLSVLGTAVAFVALFWLVPRVPVAVIGSIPLVDTLIAVLLGAIVLGETLSARILAGGAMIVAGVLLATRSAPARKSGEPTPKSP